MDKKGKMMSKIPERIWVVINRMGLLAAFQEYEPEMWPNNELHEYILAPKWVSVEDGLPESCEDVYFVRQEAPDYVLSGHILDGQWYAFRGGKVYNVTQWHWKQPLPAPPDNGR